MSGTVQIADACGRDADILMYSKKTCARDRTRFPRAGPVIGARYDGSARGVPVSQVTLRRTVVPPGHT